MSLKSPFIGIDHKVFVVKDMQPAIEFWQTQMGIQLEYRTTSEEHGVDQAFFPLSDGTFIEVLAPTRTPSPVSKIIERRGEGLYVLAMKVADLDSAVDQLKANGANIAGEGTDRVFIQSEAPGTPMIQLWPEDRPHRWRDHLTKNSESP